MATIRHLETKFNIARYDLITQCEANELQLYLYLKLYAINKSSAFPSMDTINADLGWTKRKLRYTINKMKGLGRLKHEAGSGRRSSIYDFTWYDLLNEGGVTKSQGQGLPKCNLRGNLHVTRTNSNITNKNITNFSSQDMRLAKILYTLIKQNSPTHREPNFDKWADDVRKIRTLDGRTEEQIEAIIRWAQKDDFWQSIILSPSNLRKQFDALVIKTKRGGRNRIIIA